MNNGHFEQMCDCWSSELRPATYYRTVASQARRLQADVTTPRVKQYLDKMIVHCEQLAGKGEQPRSRPLNRPDCVDQPRGKIGPSARSIFNEDTTRLAPPRVGLVKLSHLLNVC